MITIPAINPVQFYWMGEEVPSNNTLASSVQANLINTPYYGKTRPSFYVDSSYKQKWQQSDLISINLQTTRTGTDWYTGAGIYLVLLDRHGLIYKIESFYQVGTLANGVDCYRANMQLYDVDEGCYTLRIDVTQGNETSGKSFLFTSEELDIKEFHEDTLLCKYHNSRASQGILWTTTDHNNSTQRQYFMMRLPAYFNEQKPNNKTFVFEDDPLNLTLVHGDAYNDEELITEPIPEWLSDKINRVFMCDHVNIEDKFYTISEGSKVECSKVEAYGLYECKVKLRAKENDNNLQRTTGTNRILKFNFNYEVLDCPFYINDIRDASLNVLIDIKKHFASIRHLCYYLNNYKYSFEYNAAFYTKGNDLYLNYESEPLLYNTYDVSGTKIVDNTYRYGIRLDRIEPNSDNYPELDTTVGVICTAKPSAFGGYTYQQTPSTSPLASFYCSRPMYIFMNDSNNDLNGKNAGYECIVSGLFKAINTLLDIQGIAIVEIKDNVFAKASATTLNLSANKLSTAAIDKVIRFLHEAGQGAFAVAPQLNLQTPLSPPSSTVAMSIFKNVNGVGCITD